jgi:predicted O-methyltransferase YrrM
MKLKADHETIIAEVVAQYPEFPDILKQVKEGIHWCKGQISDFQAAALYALTRQYDKPGRVILEIGTAYGFSAAIMAKAAPEAQIITINPQSHEVKAAEFALWEMGIDNVDVQQFKSTDYFWVDAIHKKYDMIFVDGDHKRVREDFPFFNKLSDNGLFLFHDYAPSDSWRACPPVFEALNERSEAFRGFDVLVSDLEGVAIAGWYRRKGEAWKL